MLNSGLKKLVGSPIDASAGGMLGADTEAAKRPTKAASIENGRFTSKCSMYGTEGVDVGGGNSSGKRSAGQRGLTNSVGFVASNAPGSAPHATLSSTT